MFRRQFLLSWYCYHMGGCGGVVVEMTVLMIARDVISACVGVCNISSI